MSRYIHYLLFSFIYNYQREVGGDRLQPRLYFLHFFQVKEKKLYSDTFQLGYIFSVSGIDFHYALLYYGYKTKTCKVIR